MSSDIKKNLTNTYPSKNSSYIEMTQHKSVISQIKNKGLIAELSVLFNTDLREALYPKKNRCHPKQMTNGFLQFR